MPNKNYRHGRAREYAIKKALEKLGMVALRTAGSHGFCDLIAFDKETSDINLIQVKPPSLSNRAKERLRQEISWAARDWHGRVHVVSLAKEL